MSNFTPEQIQEILDLYFENFAHRQYIGARYVPIFGRKDETSIEWDNTAPYEPLTIVLHEGNSYTSRQFVPVGVAITNNAYWAETGNFNAQVEQYRQEVLAVAETVDGITAKIGDGFSSENTITAAINSINTEIGDGFSSENTVATAVNGINAEIGDGFSSDNTISDNVQTLTEEVTKLANARKLFLIGDSYMANTTVVRDALVDTTEYVIENHAVAGTGFIADAISSGKTFINQLIDIFTDNPDIGKDDAILLYGGVNDYSSNQSVDDVVSAISAFYAKYKEYTSLPKLMLVFCNAPNHFNGHADFIPWQAEIKAKCADLSIPIVQYSEYWLLPELQSVWGSDDHPNLTGCRVIASYLSQILKGEYTGVHREWAFDVNANSGITANYAKCFGKFDNGLISMQPNLYQATAAGAGSYQAFVSPYKLCFGLNNQTPPIGPIVEDNTKAGSGGSWDDLYWLFNVSQSIVYLMNPDSSALTNQDIYSGAIVTYSPTLLS